MHLSRLALVTGLVAAAGPVALGGGAALFGGDPTWVVVGTRGALVIWGGAAIALAFYARRHARPACALVAGLAVAMSVCGLAAPRATAAVSDRAGARLALLACRRQYQRVIAERPGQIVVFNRGGMPWAFQAIVYDASDEILRPLSSRSSAWRARAERTELTCSYAAYPLGDHFYAAHLSC